MRGAAADVVDDEDVLPSGIIEVAKTSQATVRKVKKNNLKKKPTSQPCQAVRVPNQVEEAFSFLRRFCDAALTLADRAHVEWKDP